MRMSEILRMIADTIEPLEEYDPTEVTPDNPVEDLAPGIALIVHHEPEMEPEMQQEPEQELPAGLSDILRLAGGPAC
jgi:hypothetical protein